MAKRLELLRELVPNAAVIAVLVNPNNAERRRNARETFRTRRARSGCSCMSSTASTEGEIDAAFATSSSSGPVRSSSAAIRSSTASASNLSRWRRVMRMPAIYDDREFAAAGGLMSYGSQHTDELSSGRHLCRHGSSRASKPGRPARSCSRRKFELVINLKTAKALGLEVPPTLLARADEVIE